MPIKDPEKRREYDRNYRKKNRKKLNEQQHRWKKEHPEAVAASNKKSVTPEKKREYSQRYKADGRAKDSQRKSRYGLSRNQFVALLEEQKNLCLICEEPFAESPASIDHDHNTGKIRGLIHRKCNSMIGLAGDNPAILEKAAAYLRSEKWTGFLMPDTTGDTKVVVGVPTEQPNPVSVG